MTYRIIGIGKSEPEYIVTNAMMEQMVDTTAQWIEERTGIHERRFAQGETMRQHALVAAEQAIADAGIAKEEIEYIFFATISGDYKTPAQASVLAHDLGIACPGIDVNAACAGFLYALDLAEGKFLQGMTGKILVVGMEFMSRYIDMNDRRTCVLFGDGGGAVVLDGGHGKIASHYQSTPNIDVLQIENNNQPCIQMNGKEVYRYAVNVMVNEVNTLCAMAGIAVNDVDLVIPHQANARILEGALSRLALDPEKMICRIAKRGNTSAGSIPMVLDDLYREGLLKEGMKIIMAAFGGGLSSGGVLIEWTK